MAVLRNRLVVLHHFSDLFCPLVPLFHLSAPQLRTLIVPAVKEAAFRKVRGGSSLITGYWVLMDVKSAAKLTSSRFVLIDT